MGAVPLMLDLPGDVCDRCRHTLDDDGRCPMCGRSRPMASAAELLVAELEAYLREQGDVGGRP